MGSTVTEVKTVIFNCLIVIKSTRRRLAECPGFTSGNKTSSDVITMVTGMRKEAEEFSLPLTLSIVHGYHLEDHEHTSKFFLAVNSL